MILALISASIGIAILLVALIHPNMLRHTPAAVLGRIGFGLLGLLNLVVAIAAIVGDSNDETILYASAALIVSVASATLAVYFWRLAPDAHRRVHPSHPSVEGEMATAFMGRVASGVFLILAIVIPVALLVDLTIT